MENKFSTAHFDIDVTLRDAALDEDNRPTKRALANACIGVEPFDTYYSTRELLDALVAVHEETEKGKAKLAQILSAHCDDFQRCLYYSLAGRGVVQMLDDLGWLLGLLKARTEIAADLMRQGRQMRLFDPPYISAQPDGPVPSVTADYELGPSWFIDPALGGSVGD